jgi:hypothetical protein
MTQLAGNRIRNPMQSDCHRLLVGDAVPSGSGLASSKCTLGMVIASTTGGSTADANALSATAATLPTGIAADMNIGTGKSM